MARRRWSTARSSRPVAEGKIEIRNTQRRQDLRRRAGGHGPQRRVLAILDPDGKERATHRLTYGAKLNVNEGDKVKRGQRLAEWDPYTRPILAEVEGEVAFEDLVDGTSDRGNDRRSHRLHQARRHRLARPASAVPTSSRPSSSTARAQVAKVERGGDARYLLSVDAVIAVEPGEKVVAGDVLARIPLESAKTKDITGGLPRVAELFEARRPKDHAIIAEIDGTIRFGRDYKNKRRIIIEPRGQDARSRSNT